MNFYPAMFSWTQPLCRPEKEKSVTLCNLGSSMGALSFAYKNPAHRNWGVAPQCIAYSLKLLKFLSPALADGAAVILPIAPFDSCLYEYREDSANWKYYPLLPPDQITGYTAEKHQEITAYLAANPVPPDPRIVLTENPKQTREELEADADFWMDVWHKNFGIADFSAPFPAEYAEERKKSLSALREIRKFCADNGFRFIPVQTPCSEYLRKKLTGSMLENYVYSYLREAGVLDLLIDELDSMPDAEFYVDSFFLNLKGRQLFTEQILKKTGIE